MRIFLLIVVASFLMISCKKETAISSTVAQNSFSMDASKGLAGVSIISHSATPKQTDPDINTETLFDPVQIAYLPANAANRKDKLFIFIPGTISTPSGYLKITKAAATNGYYAFGIAYSNILPVEFYAGSSPDNNTVENIMNEYLTGNNSSPAVNIKKASSFENRILKMIEYMDSLYPAENWKRFITSTNEIEWNKISIAGHSQGSDHAMFIGQKRDVLRVGLFAGPGDFKLPGGSFPSFMTDAGITSRENFYGFNHTADDIRLWPVVSLVWNALQIPGIPESIDKRYLTLPTHQLTTSINTNNTHGFVVSDNATPLNAQGIPSFEPVWRYMCFP
jgi:hypothetical protein